MPCSTFKALCKILLVRSSSDAGNLYRPLSKRFRFKLVIIHSKSEIKKKINQLVNNALHGVTFIYLSILF